MKIEKIATGSLLIIAVALMISCSKTRVAEPSGKAESICKDAPALIESRADYALLNVFPSFTGGDSLFMQFLTDHVTFPQEAKINHVSGKVFASFIVETDGSISNIEIVKGIGHGCDEAVTAALGRMPSWSAGMIKGNKVRVKLIVPFEFKN
jgi:hypothetical protein